jgi:uncharacterized protein (DUF1778 family)
MKAQPSSNDPGRILAHASLYLWKYWRQYALTAWEDAESILRQAYDAVEEEDRIQFIRALDGPSGEQTNIQNAAAGVIAEWQKAAKDLTGTEVLNR